MIYEGRCPSVKRSWSNFQFTWIHRIEEQAEWDCEERGKSSRRDILQDNWLCWLNKSIVVIKKLGRGMDSDEGTSET